MKQIDEITAKIITMLTAIANEVFNALKLEPGTYTAAEMAANARRADKTKRNIYDPKAPGLEDSATIEGESFKYDFPRRDVFYFLDQMEKLGRIPAKDKARFTREAEAGTVFYVEIPKAAKGLEKMVDGGLRPSLEQITLDLNAGALFASDTKVLAEIPVTIEGGAPDGLEHVFINPRHIKQLTGRVRVNITDTDVIFTNAAGNSYTNELTETRPAPFRSVYNNRLSLDGYLKISGASAKVSLKAIAAAAKDPKNVITFAAEAGARVAHMHITHLETRAARDITLALEAAPAVNVAIAFNAEVLNRALPGWTGGMWYKSQSCPAVFDTKDTRVIIVMPVNMDLTQYTPEDVTGKICTLDRRAALTTETAAAPVEIIHPGAPMAAAPTPAAPVWTSPRAANTPESMPGAVTPTPARPASLRAANTPAWITATLRPAAPVWTSPRAANTPVSMPGAATHTAPPLSASPRAAITPVWVRAATHTAPPLSASPRAAITPVWIRATQTPAPPLSASPRPRRPAPLVYTEKALIRPAKNHRFAAFEHPCTYPCFRQHAPPYIKRKRPLQGAAKSLVWRSGRRSRQGQRPYG